MEKERLNYLHQQYIEETMSESELQEWKLAIADASADEDIQVEMDRYWADLAPHQLMRLPAAQSDEVFDRIIKRQAEKRKTRYAAIWIAAAAVLMLIGSIVIYNARESQTGIRHIDVAATLTLPDGRSVALSQNKQRLVVDARSIKYGDGSPLQSAVVASRQASFKVSTPRGSTYEVILPDGTRVWLNAASELHFPGEFSSRSREVRLTGEAYFEVVHNHELPFRVFSAGQQVEVLGTRFNINAYENERVIKTTLLEGAVRVSEAGTSTLLRPGHQATNTDGRFAVAAIDVNGPVSWRNKQFRFEGENIRTIMRMIERWYDVETVYRNGISKETFSGGVSRFDDLSEVLKSLESTGSVEFEVLGRTVYVTTRYD